MSTVSAMTRQGNYSYDKPWLRRERTECRNPECDAVVVGQSEYNSLTLQQRRDQKVRRVGSQGYCYACYCRLKRNGTVAYQSSSRRPRVTKPPEPCLGTCGRMMVPGYLYSKMPREERSGLTFHSARGLCMRCRRAAERDGTFDDYEPRRRLNGDVLEEWELLRSQGVWDLKVAADRIGISYSALDMAIWRGAQKGDPRAVRPHRNLRSAA